MKKMRILNPIDAKIFFLGDVRADFRKFLSGSATGHPDHYTEVVYPLFLSIGDRLRYYGSGSSGTPYERQRGEPYRYTVEVPQEMSSAVRIGVGIMNFAYQTLRRVTFGRVGLPVSVNVTIAEPHTCTLPPPSIGAGIG